MKTEHEETMAVAEGVALALARDSIEAGRALDAKIDALEAKLLARIAAEEALAKAKGCEI